MYYHSNTLVLLTSNRSTRLLKTIKPSKEIKSNIITLDIETRLIDNVMTPYCISIYDGENAWSYYITDYPDVDTMIKYALASLFISKYKNHKVYIHNLSSFDGVFLLRILNDMGNITTSLTQNNGKIINLNVHYGNKYTLSLRDSLLLLPASLDKLAKTFNKYPDQHKSIFPILFTSDQQIDIDYVGPVPDYKYYKGITFEEYIQYKNEYEQCMGDWSLRDESIQYCERDCISLFYVLQHFNELIFDKFNLNIMNYPTLSSLAFGIYRSNFLKEDEFKIPLVSGSMLQDIKQSYYGGHTDVYKPYGRKLYHYDVNSLYPFVMKNYPMPVGPVKFVEGDPTHIFPNGRPFGFFQVEITCPENIDKPILMTRITKDGKLITTCPTGKWMGVIFSEEMYNAELYGYKFKILRGYLFHKANIFHDYVNVLYKIKCNTPKSDPMYMISKLLLNSLYGRFGLHAETLLSKTMVLSNEEMYEINDKITDVIPLSEDKNYVTFIAKNEIQMDNLNHMNISLPIAAAVTAYARIHMARFKNSKKYNIHYTDTDSIIIDKPLSKSQISETELGSMKLENVYKDFVALAPKVYGGITINGDEITKVKGYKNKVSFETLKSLLKCPGVTSVKLNHTKWIRDFERGEIKIQDQIYSLIPTTNKRKLIIKEGELIDTKAYNIHNDKITNPK